MTITVFHGTGKNFHYLMRGFLCILAAVLILAGFATPAFAQAWYAGKDADGNHIFNVDDEHELRNAIEYDTHEAGAKKIINFIGSISVEAVAGGAVYDLKKDETVTLNLNGYNFMGNGQIAFQVDGSGGGANLTIRGSTMQFKGGMRLEDSIVLTYQGKYTSGGTDLLRTPNDGIGIKVLLTESNSSWAAEGHDIIIGHSYTQPSEFFISNGNWAKSGNVYVGGAIDTYTNLNDGTLHIWGAGTNWENSENFIIGIKTHGSATIGNVIGELNLYEGALLTTGNFGVGVSTAAAVPGPPDGTAGGTAGKGIANIYGAGTVLKIVGSTTATKITDDGTATDNELNVTKRAEVYIRYHDIDDNGSGYEQGNLASNPNELNRPAGILALGEGTSSFDNAYFMIDRGTIDGGKNDMTFNNYAIFEGGNYGFVKTVDAGTGKIVYDFDYANFGTQDGTQVGSTDDKVIVKLASLTFSEGGIFSPGYGNKSLWENRISLNIESQKDLVTLYNLGRDAEPFDEFGNPLLDWRGNLEQVGRYGGIEFAGDFKLNPGGLAIFDFDPEGDTKHPLVGSATDEAKTNMHKDFVNLASGSATLDSTVHFRPMPGYYQDDITIDFITGAASVPQGAHYELSLWPQRWFGENSWEIADGTGTLTMTREERPFFTSGDSFNEKSVGVALDGIYNKHWEDNNEKRMLTLDKNGQQDDIWFPVLDWMWGMSDDQFREALRQLSGETRAASFFMPLRSPWQYGFDRVNWRKRDNHVYFGQQNIREPHLAKQDVWVTPYYDYLHMGNDGNTSRAGTSRVSFMAGYDRALSKYSAIGFLFGYSQPKLQQVFSRVIADDYMFGLHYNRRVCNDFELKLWGSYGTQFYRLSRSVPIGNGEKVSARYKGNSWTGSIQVAKPYSFLKTGMIRPLMAVDYSFVQQSDASEVGYDPIALNYRDSDWSQLFGRVGVRGDFGWSRFSLTSSLSYSYQFAGDVSPTVTNQFQIDPMPEFDIKGPNLGRSFVHLGLGSQIYLNRLKSRMFFIQYNGSYGSRTNAQNASLGYQMTF